MTTPVRDIQGVEGSTITINIQVQADDGTPADLSDFTGQIQVRPEALSEDVLATGTVSFPGNGVVVAQIAAADTVQWSAGFYDVRIVSPGGVVEYIARGKILLEPAVTRP